MIGDQRDFMTPISGGGFTSLVWGIEIRTQLTSSSWNTPEMDFHLNLADEKFHLFLRRSPLVCLGDSFDDRATSALTCGGTERRLTWTWRKSISFPFDYNLRNFNEALGIKGGPFIKKLRSLLSF